MDVALVQYINRLCRHLAITPARLHPHEVYLDPGDAADPRVACLLSTYAACLLSSFTISVTIRGHQSDPSLAAIRFFLKSDLPILILALFF